MLIIGFLQTVVGVVLVVFRRTLLEWFAGGTRVKLGLFFGVDRVHTALWTTSFCGVFFILMGLFLMFLWYRRKQGNPSQAG